MTKSLTTTLLIICFVSYIIISIAPTIMAHNIITHKDFTVTGHRGAAGLAPENTISAMQAALDAGVDMIECDIHLTKDNVVVVCHDTSIDRTTTGKGKISDLTIEEVKSYNIVDSNGEITNLKIPTLDELLEFINGRTELLIEIKRKGRLNTGIEDKMVELINKHNAIGWTCVQSFDDSAIENTHALLPELAIEKLFIFKLWGLPIIFDMGFSKFSAEKYDNVRSFNIYHRSVSKLLVHKIHAMGKSVRIWTIKDGDSKIPDIGIDGIITDRPDIWR